MESLSQGLGILYCLEVTSPTITPASFQWHPGNNVGLGKDYTIYAKIDGLVKFEKKGLNRALVIVITLMSYKFEKKVKLALGLGGKHRAI